MGYDVYLVKTRSLFDEENKFTETEWKTLCAKHRVADWLHYDGDDITVKNPSKEQLVALVRIARSCGWTVQGDDGETYAEDGSLVPAAPLPKPGILSRLKHLLSGHRADKSIENSAQEIACPFSVGDKVCTTYRSGGVVISVDPSGHHGTGSIKVRFPDGTILGGIFAANDFRIEGSQRSDESAP
jgi:hypothetical protein